MQRKIGEIFEYKGEWYQCVEGRCKDCHFSEKRYLCKQFIVKNFCLSGIIFKKLEKVGEPYEFDGHLFQSYRTFEVPIFTENYATVRELGNNSKISIEIKQTNKDMEEITRSRIFQIATKYINGGVTFDEFEKAMRNWINGNKRESKPNLKPFDLEAAKAGKPVCTRDGRKARIICFDRVNAKPILALIASTDRKGEDVFDYFVSGKRIANALEIDLDLMMLTEKKEGWINLPKDTVYFDKKEIAEKNCLQNYSTVKIEWEE